MSELAKQLKARIIHKHKTEAEWRLDVYDVDGNLRDDPFVPLDGELIIFDPEAEGGQKRFKFGDGSTNVIDLPFVEDVMTSITHANLKQLRDSNKLIPSMFYRITDYKCTTTQENTRALDNKFDIIVQALSANTLSENASADYHWEDVAKTYTLDPSVLDENNKLIENSVIHYYDEYIDFDVAATEGVAEYKSTDIFIAYDYLENNEGICVPVLYKTDYTGLESAGEEYNPDFAGPDYGDAFFYVGTATIDGIVYDKWRKTEAHGANELTWESSAKVFAYTNVIVEVEESEEVGFEIVGITPDMANIPAWKLRYCLDNDSTRFAWACNELFITNLKTNFSNGEWLVRQPYADGMSNYDEYPYAWGTPADVDDGDSTNFIYSRTETIASGDVVYDASYNEYTTAEVTTKGKGVIYWMKDEYNNECPYDFKNIQFLRNISLKNGYPELDEDNGEETWVYTFCGNERDLDNDSWSDLKDGSLESPYGHQCDDINELYSFSDNIMKPFVKGCDNNDEDPTKVGVMYLNNIVMLGCWDSRKLSQGDYSHFVGCKANVFGNNCFDITFGKGCYFNTFGNSCYSNTFGENCRSNTFGNSCYSNTFGNGCYFNIFGNNCFDITFGNNCYSNTFDNGCYSNTFDENCSSNTFGNDCGSNTFGRTCYSNTFGNGCSFNTFGNSCYSNTFGNDCYFNIFSNDGQSIDYVKNIYFKDRCQYINLINAETASDKNYVQDITVSIGIKGTSDNYRELQVARNAPPVVYEAAGTTHIILD